MTETTMGQATGGKAINLSQLQGELEAQSVDVGRGLGTDSEFVFRYLGAIPENEGEAVAHPADFLPPEQATVDQAIADHVAMRDKTDEEYAAEFQDPNTTAVRKQEIRDITAGLLPREQVPM